MPRKTSADHPHHARTWFLVAITVILAGWALRATATFLVPMVFAIFLALVVAPLDGKVGQAVPRRFGWLGHVAAMGTILVALLLALGLIWFAAQQVVERLPFTGATRFCRSWRQGFSRPKALRPRTLRHPTTGAAERVPPGPRLRIWHRIETRRETLPPAAFLAVLKTSFRARAAC